VVDAAGEASAQGRCSMISVMLGLCAVLLLVLGLVQDRRWRDED
jgi:hypothetical protein